MPRFNPRTPCGVRLGFTFVDCEDERVSIHALLAECDDTFLLHPNVRGGFNPRTPCGVRPVRRLSEVQVPLFQSTHSLRSATIIDMKTTSTPVVSIHALLAECDPQRCNVGCRPEGFNPRTPCGVRHKLLNAVYSGQAFQSTHSLRSATYQATQPSTTRKVSIHALLAECDLFCLKIPGPHNCFNPRTPCGVRRRLTIYIVIQQRKRYFAPTSRRRPSSPSLLF